MSTNPTPQTEQKQATETKKSKEQQTQQTKQTKQTKQEKIDESNIKHPLQHAWTLWYDYPGRKSSTTTYDKFLKKVYTFSTVSFFNFFEYIFP